VKPNQGATFPPKSGKIILWVHSPQFHGEKTSAKGSKESTGKAKKKKKPVGKEKGGFAVYPLEKVGGEAGVQKTRKKQRIPGRVETEKRKGLDVPKGNRSDEKKGESTMTQRVHQKRTLSSRRERGGQLERVEGGAGERKKRITLSGLDDSNPKKPPGLSDRRGFNREWDLLLSLGRTGQGKRRVNLNIPLFRVTILGRTSRCSNPP